MGFFEDYVYAKERGFIAFAEISPEGQLLSPSTSLEHPECHYSYPYVFQDGPELFMIPESYESGRVDLYRCDQFPDKWVLQKTMLQGKFVDTSVWKQDGLWWMLTTRAEPDSRSSCLFL